MASECPKCEYPMDGKCWRCHEDQMRLRNHGVVVLGGVRPYEDFTVEKFSPSARQKPALDACVSFDPGRDNLYLAGPVGSGKSHLATIAARRFLDRLSILTVTPSEISRDVRSSKSEATSLKAIMSRAVLVIDDLGAQKDTEFMVGLLLDIINHRYLNHRGGLIVTSNLKFSELAEKMADDRCSSRLAQMCKFFDLTGEPDHRLQSTK